MLLADVSFQHSICIEQKSLHSMSCPLFYAYDYWALLNMIHTHYLKLIHTIILIHTHTQTYTPLINDSDYVNYITHCVAIVLLIHPKIFPCCGPIKLYVLCWIQLFFFLFPRWWLPFNNHFPIINSNECCVCVCVCMYVLV